MALNLSKKLEWMSRRLRWIDEVAEIQQWVAAMTNINKLMKEVASDTETYKDNWKPYKAEEQSEKCLQSAKIVECGKKLIQKRKFSQNVELDVPKKDIAVNHVSRYKNSQKRKASNDYLLIESTADLEKAFSQSLIKQVETKYNENGKVYNGLVDKSDSASSANLILESCSNHIVVEEEAIELNTQWSLHPHKPDPITKSCKLKWKAEAETLIAEDLKYYQRLPGEECRNFITNEAIEVTSELIERTQQAVTRATIHNIVHHLVKKRVGPKTARE